MDVLYRNIKSRREELGISQEDLAKKLNYKSRSSINKIELGINDLPQSKVKEFAIALDTSVSALMGWSSDPNVANKNDDLHTESPETDGNEKELLTTYRELNTDNQAYIRVRSKELLKDQISTKEAEKSDSKDTKIYKIASRNGKGELELTEEQRKAIVETIMNHKKTDVGDLI